MTPESVMVIGMQAIKVGLMISAPVLLAALGPKNVELAAEIAEGWQPIFYMPEKAKDGWGDALAAGYAKRDATLPPMDIYAGPALAIGDNVEGMREFIQPHIALYIGGMGAKGKNFYPDLACRYGFAAAADEIQEAYLAGKFPNPFADIASLYLPRTIYEAFNACEYMMLTMPPFCPVYFISGAPNATPKANWCARNSGGL